MALDTSKTTATVFDARVIKDEDRQALSHQVAHIAHMLSEQGPMSVTFVHNNTLLGLQSNHFEEAIKISENFSGGRGYLDNAAYRAYHAAGRITDADIKTALTERKDLDTTKAVGKTGLGKITSGHVYFLNMRHGFDAMTPGRLNDQIDSGAILTGLDEGISDDAKSALLASATEDAAAVRQIANTADFAAWLNQSLGANLGQGQTADLDADIADFLHERFEVGPAPQDLATFISANPEHWAVQSLWAATLEQLGLEVTTKVEGAADQLRDTQRLMEQFGGPLIPIDADTRAMIKSIVASEVDALDKITERGAAERTRARVAWTILHGLSETSLDRQGYAALTTLLTQRAAKSGPESKLSDTLRRIDPRGQMVRRAGDMLTSDLAALQSGENHADFVERITEADITKNVNDYMIGVCSAFLDEGLASWHMPSRAIGFYDSWRNLVRSDRSFDFDEVTDWRMALDQLPLDPTDAVITQLMDLGVPQDGWSDYCGRALAHLRGWAGMVFWRQENASYGHQQAQPIDLMQYLAVRLFYQNLLATKTCTATWNLQPGMGHLSTHFGANLEEYFVRRELYAGRLEDGLAQ